MGLRDVQRTLHIYCYEFENVANMDDLNRYDKHAADDINRLYGVIAQIQEYRKELAQQALKVLNMQRKRLLTIKRIKHYQKNVEYIITIDVTYENMNPVNELRESYTGAERHKALARFEELKKQNNGIEVVKDIEKGKWER